MISLIRKSFLIFIVCILFSIVLFGQEKTNLESHYYVKSKIIIASEPDYPPYCIVDKNGKADGLSIDLFKESAKSVGLEVEIKIGVWNKIKQDLADGEIDALPLVGRTPERESLYDFTMPYLRLHGAVFVREGSTDINSIADLKNKTIVLMKGDNAEEYVRREKISNYIVTTNTFSEAFQRLAAGEYDAVIMQRVTGIKLLESLGINSIVVSNVQLPEYKQDFCFAVKRGNHALLSKLNEGLSIIIANKKYDEIRLKWFGPEEKKSMSLADILKTIVYTLIVVTILMSVIFVFILRRQVKSKTKDLQNEIDIRKHTELQKELYGKVLELYHHYSDKKNLIKEIIDLVKAHSGCEAVGIRLKEGEDYPYYETNRFVEGHVKYENFLCAINNKGEIVRDYLGNPVLECMCGNIICGRFDPNLSFFTVNGSFWTNSTTELLASTTEEDRQARTRNRCNGEGYESVAIIPIKGEVGNIGLLQLNDSGRNRFTRENIAFYENLSQAIGITLLAKHAEEELKKSQEMLSKLAERVPGVVYQYLLYPDGKSCFPFSSPGMLDIYGLTPEELLADATPVFERLHPDDYDMIVSTIMESARTLEFYHSEFRVILPEQGVRWRLCNAKPERLDDGSTLWYGIISDITDRKQVEGELEKHRLHLEDLVQSRTEEIDTINKQLQGSLEKEKELSSLKSRFISTASHEFRTPLTSVLTSAELIQRYYERWNQDKVNEHLNRIKNSVGNLTKLMDDVLMVNRAESGRTVLQRSNVDLHSICNNVLEEVEVLAEDHHDIVLNYATQRNYFLVDQKQIELILQNLISNAIKYSPNGGEININVSADEKNLEFRISDTGIGIPEEDLPRLFEPFHRSKNSLDIQGTGLGLSIVKHAVEIHGGKIEVESREGFGSTFIVSIPILE